MAVKQAAHSQKPTVGLRSLDMASRPDTVSAILGAGARTIGEYESAAGVARNGTTWDDIYGTTWDDMNGRLLLQRRASNRVDSLASPGSACTCPKLCVLA